MKKRVEESGQRGRRPCLGRSSDISAEQGLIVPVLPARALARCRPKVVAVVGHVSALAVAVKKTDALAESISAKVRQLDLQQVRALDGRGGERRAGGIDDSDSCMAVLVGGPVPRARTQSCAQEALKQLDDIIEVKVHADGERLTGRESWGLPDALVEPDLRKPYPSYFYLSALPDVGLALHATSRTAPKACKRPLGGRTTRGRR